MFLRSPHSMDCPLKSVATSSLFLVLIGVHPSKSANWMARLPSMYLLFCGSMIFVYRHCLFAARYSGSQSSENVTKAGGFGVLLCLSSCCSGSVAAGASVVVVLNVTNSALLVRLNSSSISCLLMLSCQLACSVKVSN